MPTADSATINPTNNNKAREALLTALRKDSSSPVADRSKRASMPADIHKVNISTTLAVSSPSTILRTDKWLLPTLQPIWSSAFNIAGSRPLTHKTITSQANQEIVCSRARAQRD